MSAEGVRALIDSLATGMEATEDIHELAQRQADRIEYIAGRALFRLAEERGARLRDIAQIRHMLYRLDVVIEGERLYG